METNLRNDTAIERAVNVINQVVNITIAYSEMTEINIAHRFGKVFAHKNDKLVNHYVSEFIYNNKKDFGRFFFSCEVKIIRELFDYHKIEIEPDKFSGEGEMRFAQMFEKDKSKVYPFEYLVVRLFYLMALNNSLELLEEISPEALAPIKAQKINLYGNGINWAMAWNVLDNIQKKCLVDYLLNEKWMS